MRMRAPRAAAVLLLCLTLIGCSSEPVDDPTVQRPASPAPPVPTASPTTNTTPTTPASAPATAAGVRLTGNGIDLPDRLLELGARYDEARPALIAALGTPTKDGAEESSFSGYGTCPGDRLRALEFGGGALVVLFGDVDGAELTMFHWSLHDRGRPADVPQAVALVGDTATFGFGVGDTVAELREGSSGAELEVQQGDEIVGPTFRLTDQSAGFFGYLTGTSGRDTVTGVVGGQECGE